VKGMEGNRRREGESRRIKEEEKQRKCLIRSG
jgi:hypothetical protein